jgi:hypothetical protein
VLGEGGGGIEFEVDVPPRAVFQADVGLRTLPGPDGNAVHANAVRLEVAVSTADETGDPDAIDASASFRTLASESVRFERGAGGNWRSIEVDLSEFAGSRIALRLQAIPHDRVRQGALAWWGSPRIALRPSP